MLNNTAKAVFLKGLRFNPLGIEMLPNRIYKQVFGSEGQQTIPSTHNLKRCIEHLNRHDLLPKQLSSIDTIYEYHKHLSRGQLEEGQTLGDVVMDIPKLEGTDIDKHFKNLGYRFSGGYKSMALYFLERGSKIIDLMPTQWNMEAGWTRYEPLPDGGYKVTRVDHPLDDAYVFDVETCMNDTVKHAPTMAVAMSEKAWYSWTSPRLINQNNNSDSDQDNSVKIDELISIQSSQSCEKLIVGHNVGFDRSFLRDEYNLKQSKTKFLDTLSLHMCICGLTKMQRNFKLAQKRKIKDNDPMSTEDLSNNTWIGKSCLNNLADVYEFHCGSSISKDERELFIDGSMNDIRNNYQDLMTYCANDVKATFEVFKILFPTFLERFPHPVTMAGMLDMSTMYLPVNTDNWSKYINRSQKTYDLMEDQLSSSLQEIAKDACSKTKEEYSNDVWLWDLDWSVQSLTPNKSKMKLWLRDKDKLKESELSLDEQVQQIYDSRQFMRLINPFLPGFPKWYRDICCPRSKASSLLGDRIWQDGPCLITTQMRLTPKLMKLTWDGYPLHFNQKHGWGYLVPNGDLVAQYVKPPEGHPYELFPTEQLRLLCKDLPRSHILLDDETQDKLEADRVQAQIEKLMDDTQIGTLNLIKLLRKISKKKKLAPKYKNEFCEDVEIPGAYFIKLPHRNGPAYNVGNPLSRDFVGKVEDGTLSSRDNELAKLLLHHSSSLSYWKNSHKRIKNQMVVQVDSDGNGAILPRVVVAGTVTRRAVEPTWLTASNQDTGRIGSELKAMIQAPKGYCFVGADVDSQELWIASLMGDSYSYKIHGGTGLSYMTLRGSKSDKTDMHSKTASLIGISRSDAKVLNYARIYGAGRKFIERFLANTNNQLSPEEAKEKASTIFKETKGVKKFYYLKSCMFDGVENQDESISIPVDVSQTDRNRSNLKMFWEGGTESATFNKLEEIASSVKPRTPVLECQMSQALEPSQDQAKDFATSRVNWVVQSSAVDFLHLVLVNTKWLFDKLNIEGRFSISIHDEVRYLVKYEDRYKAAFALQVSNLLVRAYFAYKLNMSDLPISVAFFSSVDIDKCLRKEVSYDCKSPSNPQGLETTYGIGPGESLDVKHILKHYSYMISRPNA